MVSVAMYSIEGRIAEIVVQKGIGNSVTKVMLNACCKNSGICNVEQLCYTAREYINEGAYGVLNHQQGSVYRSIKD